MMGVTGAALAGLTLNVKRTAAEAMTMQEIKKGENVFAYTERIHGKFDQTLYQQVIGAANDFKEGDLTIDVGAKDEATRINARELLANTKIKDLYEHPLFVDDLQKLLWQTIDQAQYEQVKDWTMGQLKEFILTSSEPEIKAMMAGLNSDVIACVTKICSNDELIAIGQKVFNPLPGRMGSRGYMGARIQPNSPTDIPMTLTGRPLTPSPMPSGMW